MKKNKKIKLSFFRFLKLIYLKLFRINDTAQKIALGFALGAFFGIIPGSGPIAALFFAFIFRANRASALLGSIITNTWLSVVTFIAAVQLGGLAVGQPWQSIYQENILLWKNFQITNFFKVSVLKIIFPIIIGYLIVAFFIGLATYFFILIIVSCIKRYKRKKI